MATPTASSIGKRDRLVGLESYTETKSPLSGGVSTTWHNEGQVWAQVRYTNGDEAVAGDQLQAVQEVVFVIGYCTGGLSTRYRVTHEGKVFDILAVAEVGRRQALELKAENRV